MINITNATLVSIAPPPVSDNRGGQSSPAAVAVGVDVFLDTPRRAQLFALTNKVADVTAVLYAPVAQAEALVVRSTVVVRLKGRTTPQTYQVAYAIDRRKDGGLSHVECYLKGL